MARHFIWPGESVRSKDLNFVAVYRNKRPPKLDLNQLVAHGITYRRGYKFSRCHYLL